MCKMELFSVGVTLSLVLGVGSCTSIQLRSASDNLLSTGMVGWQEIGEEGDWKLENGVLYTEGGSAWLSTVREYDDFVLSLEFRIPPGGNSGVFLRTPHDGNPAYQGLEIQILDDRAEKWSELRPEQYTGSIYDIQAPAERAAGKAGQWQTMVIGCRGSRVKVAVNGQTVIDTDMNFYPYKVDTHPGLTRRRGYIGLQNHGSKVEFRNIRLQPLPPATARKDP